MDKNKVRGMLSLLGITKEKMSDTPYDRLVSNLSNKSSRSDFLKELNANKKYMGHRELGENDFMKNHKDIYYGLK